MADAVSPNTGKTPEHLAAFVKEAITSYREQDLYDKRLWEAFKEDFVTWTANNFETLGNANLRLLKDFLRQRGVWVDGNRKRTTIRVALVNLVEETVPTKWTEEEVKERDFDENFTFPRIRKWIRIGFSSSFESLSSSPAITSNPALPTQSPRQILSSPLVTERRIINDGPSNLGILRQLQNSQDPRNLPHLSEPHDVFSNPGPQIQEPRRREPLNRDFQPPNRDFYQYQNPQYHIPQYQNPPAPPTKEYYRFHPPEPPYYPNPSGPQFFGQEPPKQEFLNPGYAREISNLIKMYTDESKNNGDNDTLDFKLNIFHDFCARNDVPQEAKLKALPIMLKGPALKYYQSKIITTGQPRNLLEVIEALRFNFEGAEHKRNLLSKWNAISLKSVMSNPENEGKSIEDCFQLMVSNLTDLQHGLSYALRTDEFLHNKLINACQDVSACQYACSSQVSLGSDLLHSTYIDWAPPTSSTYTATIVGPALQVEGVKASLSLCD